MFFTWDLLHFWLVDRNIQQEFLLNSFHTDFISHFVSIQNSYHFPIFFSLFPTLLNMIFSVSNNNMNWSLEFGPDTVSLEVQNFPDDAVLNSIDICCMESIRKSETAIFGGGNYWCTSNRRWAGETLWTARASNCSQPTHQSCNASRWYLGLGGTKKCNWKRFNNRFRHRHYVSWNQ